MKNLILMLLTVSSFSVFALAGQREGGGGQSTYIGENAYLRDIIEKNNCIWKSPGDVLRSNPVINDIMSSIPGESWHFKFRLNEEFQRLSFCFTEKRLPPLSYENSNDLYIFANNDFDQPAINDGGVVFINNKLFNSMPIDHKGFLFIHEIGHELYDKEEKRYLREPRLREFVMNFHAHYKEPVLPDSFALALSAAGMQKLYLGEISKNNFYKVLESRQYSQELLNAYLDLVNFFSNEIEKDGGNYFWRYGGRNNLNSTSFTEAMREVRFVLIRKLESLLEDFNIEDLKAFTSEESLDHYFKYQRKSDDIYVLWHVLNRGVFDMDFSQNLDLYKLVYTQRHLSEKKTVKSYWVRQADFYSLNAVATNAFKRACEANFYDVARDENGLRNLKHITDIYQVISANISECLENNDLTEIVEFIEGTGLQETGFNLAKQVFGKVVIDSNDITIFDQYIDEKTKKSLVAKNYAEIAGTLLSYAPLNQYILDSNLARKVIKNSTLKMVLSENFNEKAFSRLVDTMVEAKLENVMASILSKKKKEVLANTKAIEILAKKAPSVLDVFELSTKSLYLFKNYTLLEVLIDSELITSLDLSLIMENMRFGQVHGSSFYVDRPLNWGQHEPNVSMKSFKQLKRLYKTKKEKRNAEKKILKYLERHFKSAKSKIWRDRKSMHNQLKKYYRSTVNKIKDIF